jgi:exopolyphosphatase / guanosine-5'-triphosphate,3'-diphosphate pyrophosphatase
VKLAAIDIGSNSIKLVVVDAAASDSFAVLAREKEAVRLGHNTLRQGHLSKSAIERAADCVRRLRSIAEARGAEQVIAVATASVREADNPAEFISEIERQTGVRVEVLSPIEEARIIGLAVSKGCVQPGASFINIDIGGGSTEISLFQDGMPKQLFSVKLGAVGLTERFIASDPVKPKELRALKNEIAAALERPRRELSQTSWQYATGTSGTILAIGEALRLGLLKNADHKAQGAQPAGAEIPLNQLERFNSRMAEINISERRSQPGISNQRSEIIIAGGQILEGVMRALSINVMRTCDWALREGVVIDRLRELEAESQPPVADTADQRLRGVHAVGRRFGYEEAHAFHVAKLAETIFDQLADVYKLARRERILLSAAALLHDVGYHIAHESHHKHSLYLIKFSELTGFSEAERLVIANIARYHRGPTPKERHPDYGMLNQADRETVCRLGAILRVADALDKSYDSRVKEVRCVRDGQLLDMQLLTPLSCEKEILAAEQKADLFESAFNCKLTFSKGAFARRA